MRLLIALLLLVSACAHTRNPLEECALRCENHCGVAAVAVAPDSSTYACLCRDDLR